MSRFATLSDALLRVPGLSNIRYMWVNWVLQGLGSVADVVKWSRNLDVPLEYPGKEAINMVVGRQPHAIAGEG